MATTAFAAAIASITATGVPSFSDDSAQMSIVAYSRREIVDPSDQVHLLLQRERGDQRIDLGTERPVADQEQHRVRPLRRHAGKRADQRREILDRDEPPDVADDQRPLGNAELAAQVRAPRIEAGQVLEIEAERHHRGARGGRNAEPGHDVVALCRRDGHDTIGDPRQGALRQPDGHVHRRTEIAGQHVTVKRVDDEASAAARPCHVEQAGGHASERAGLGGVRVDHVGRLAEHQPEQAGRRRADR